MSAAAKYRAAMLAVVFLLFITFPLVNDSFHLLADVESTEKRGLSEEPELDINKLDFFPAKYEAYYKDKFTLRNRFIHAYYRLYLQYFKTSPIIGNVLMGKDGWLYFTGTEEKVYKGQEPLTPDELQQLADELEYRANYLEQRNCKFYMLIAPVKAYVYRQYLPDAFRMQAGMPWGMQLESYLQQRGKINIVPVHNLLRENNSIPLYKKLDNHWNETGALLAVNAAIQLMQKDFPGLQPLPPDSFTVEKKVITTGNIIHMLSYALPMTDTNFIQVPKQGFRSAEVPPSGYPAPDGFAEEYEKRRESADTTAPDIMVISDSFGNDFFPFISEHFHHSLKLFDAWHYQLHADIVEKEKPDVVLLLILESNLRGILKHKEKH